MGKISLNNIAEELAIKSNITREAADSFMHAFIATIEKGLQEDNMVKIKGLGTFKLLPVSDRSSVDVNTGERITIKGHNKVSFTPDSAMKELVNRPFAHFEPTELNDGYPSDENDELQEAGVSDENDDVEVLEPAMENAAPLTNEVTELPEPTASVEKSVVEIVEEETATEKIEPETIVASVEEDEPTVPSTPTEQECAETPEIETSEVVIPEDVAPEKEILEEEVTDEVTTEAIAHEETLSAEEDVDSETPAHEDEVAPQTVAQEEVAPVASAHEEKNTEPADAATKASVAPKKERKKRGGCIWTILLLILLVVMGVVCWFTPVAVFEKQAHEEELIENNDIVVKPNLEEELGVEWGDEPKVEVELSVKEELLAPTPVEEPAPISTDVVVESPKYQGVKTTPEVPNAKFCSVTITESLDAKTIKDITPADTTDYLMEGTLVTHQLKRGETLILLSKKYYGDKRLWPYIVKYNWMKDFNHVAIGQMVNIPVLKDKPMK